MSLVARVQQVLLTLNTPLLARLILGNTVTQAHKNIREAVALLHVLYLSSARQPADAALCRGILEQWLASHGAGLRHASIATIRGVTDMSAALFDVTISFGPINLPVWMQPSGMARIIAVDAQRHIVCDNNQGTFVKRRFYDIPPTAKPMLKSIMTLDAMGERQQQQLCSLVSVLCAMLVEVVLAFDSGPQPERHAVRNYAMAFVMPLLGMTNTVAWAMLVRCRALLKCHGPIDSEDRVGVPLYYARMTHLSGMEAVVSQQTVERAEWVLDHWQPHQLLTYGYDGDRVDHVLYTIAVAIVYPERNPVATLFRKFITDDMLVGSVVANVNVGIDLACPGEGWVILANQRIFLIGLRATRVSNWHGRASWPGSRLAAKHF